MTSRQRVVLLGLAALVAAIAIAVAVAGGGDDGEDDVIDSRTQTTATTRPSTSTQTTATTTTPRPATPTIVVRGGRPVGGVRRLTFRKGSTIRFVVRSDVAEEVHLHGYDVARDVAAGGSTRFAVPATIDGRFEVELEHSAVPLAEIEVVP